MSRLNFHWLAARQATRTAVDFGSPWAKGSLQPNEVDNVILSDDSGNLIPAQTKINAYWPDGSVKWLLHSSVLATSNNYAVVKTKTRPNLEIPTAILATYKNDVIELESEHLSCKIEPGNKLISSLLYKNTGQKPVSAQLTALIENRSQSEDMENITIHKLVGKNNKITLEESGPLRTVIKIEGVHEYLTKDKQLFPFIVRLYFYADSHQIRLVHSFAFDADENKDFLKGLAVEFELNATGDLWNRHIGFVGDTGMFYEAVQPMYGSRPASPLYKKQQIDGQFVYLDPKKHADFLPIVQDNASWDSFKLLQNSCDHYSIVKRTKPGCAFIPAALGNRSQGVAFFGDPSIIMAIGIKDFWQKYPTALEVSEATTDSPKVTAWLWSRYAEAFDFRAYDTVSHKYSYGGINNHPQGIANTNEIVINMYNTMPGKQEIIDFASDVQTDSLLIADLQAYEDTRVFGSYWCRPEDKQHRTEAHEQAFLGFVDFYINEVEQRRWYGFWDYGDVMHTYDPIRHCWRYDVGGYAWQNTELCPTYVNWLAFLRTGNYQIYRHARAMTRHTSEVDTYHLGKYAMLGTRHNVRHWGCGAKEPRISMAGHHRFFYYLTGDERIGDIMDFVKDADYATLVRDPMGNHFPKKEGFAHIRTGPDWSSFVANWMTRWERFGDTKYRDKILQGLNSLKQAPNRLASGSTFLYSPQDNLLRYLGEGNYQYHMVICFGGPETWFELADLLEDDEFKEMLAEFGAYYAMTPKERKVESKGLFNEKNDRAWGGKGFSIRMIAYAGYKFNRPELMQIAIDMLSPNPDLSSKTPGLVDKNGSLIYTKVDDPEYVRQINEIKYASTNGISQWSLNYIETAKLREMIDKG